MPVFVSVVPAPTASLAVVESSDELIAMVPALVTSAAVVSVAVSLYWGWMDTVTPAGTSPSSVVPPRTQTVPDCPDPSGGKVSVPLNRCTAFAPVMVPPAKVKWPVSMRRFPVRSSVPPVWVTASSLMTMYSSLLLPGTWTVPLLVSVPWNAVVLAIVSVPVFTNAPVSRRPVLYIRPGVSVMRVPAFVSVAGAVIFSSAVP